jgi:hypothetical protein
MIPTKSEVNITGELPGEDVQMTLDQNSLAHLMSVLSNLYSNKALAIIREYSTNARDSHIEAGVDRPIEVNTPSEFMPFLKIRDYGVGMNAETIRNVYSRYGASTKRGTNAQNGMLGLGSKSALTYTTQFNVTGIKDGIKTYVLVSRTSDGSGNMKIISQVATDEPNGVEISIPVHNKWEIAKTAKSFFRFWKPGTVLLDGKDPASLQGTEIGKFLVTTEMSGTDYIVMGNVAYPVPDDNRIFHYTYGYNTSVVVYVDMGEVNFTPSRESLHMTDLTKKTIRDLREEFNKDVLKHVEDNIKNAGSYSEALKAYFALQKSNLSYYTKGMKYKGEAIPDHFSFDWLHWVSDGTVKSGHYVNPDQMIRDDRIIVHGYDKEKIHSTHKTKLKNWLEQEDIDAVAAYWCNSIDKENWLDAVRKVHWDEIRAIKLTRTPSTPGVGNVFDTIDSRGYRLSNHKVDTTKTLVYMSPSEVSSQEAKDMVAKVLTSDKNLQILLVNKNKWKAFKTKYASAKHLNEKVKEMVDSYLSNLTEEEKLYLRSDWQDKIFCAKLDYTKILDPEIAASVKTMKTDGLSSQTEKRFELMLHLAKQWDIPFPNLTRTEKRLFEDYPLLGVYGHSSRNLPEEHIYLYMNSVYPKFIKPNKN